MKTAVTRFARTVLPTLASTLVLVSVNPMPALAHVFYAELLRTEVSAEIDNVEDFSDVDMALTLGAQLLPNLGLELTWLGDNEYPDAGSDVYGDWKTRMVTSGSLLGIRGIFPVNDAVTFIARTGIQYLDVSFDVKESSNNWNSFTHYRLEDSTERLYFGGGAQVFIGERTYLTAEYLHFNETDALFSESLADFNLSGNYVGVGLGVVF